MLLIIKAADPTLIQSFIDRNFPDSLEETGGMSLKKWQKSEGGTGYLYSEIERTWLSSQGFNNLDEYFDSIEAPAGTTEVRLRWFLTTYEPTPVDPEFLVLENSDFFLLENGDKLILQG